VDDLRNGDIIVYCHYLAIKSPFQSFSLLRDCKRGIHDINSQLITVQADPIHAQICKVSATLGILTCRTASSRVVMEILMGTSLENKFIKF